MTNRTTEEIARELLLYSASLQTWTLACEVIGDVRPLRDLLRDAADALRPPPLTEEEKTLTGRSVSAAYDAFARKAGERWPWLHPDYDPDDILWQMRADRARRRDRTAARNRGRG